MLPAFEQFRTCNTRQIVDQLCNEGWSASGDDNKGFMLSRSGVDATVTVTPHICQAQAFARICRENQGNPFFPAIHQTFLTEGKLPAFITVTERLLTLDDLPEISRQPVGGGARALALLPAGHPSHDHAHALMLRNKNSSLFRAVSALVAAIGASLKEDGGTIMRYESGFAGSSADSVEAWVPPCILFRRSGAGYQYVFADPLREIACADDSCRAAAILAHAAMLARLSSLSDKKKDPAFLRGLVVKPVPAP